MFQGMEYVYEVYKEKSFSKAAQKLFISQPYLSAAVKRIEKRVGYPIFDRSTKPLGLTECGEKYIRSVERILSIENEFSDFVNDWWDLKSGSLTLGGSSLYSSWVLPALMGEFSHLYPAVKLVLVEESTGKLEELLQRGGVDLVMDNSSLDQNIFEQSVFREEYLLLAVPRKLAVNGRLGSFQLSAEAVRRGDFLAPGMPAVPLDAFQGEPFILLKPENDTRKRGIELCQSYGFEPKVVFELDQQMTSYNITCSGMGISFISDTLISRVPPNPEVVYYKLGGENSRRKLYFYWKRGRYFSRAMDELLKIAGRHRQSIDFIPKLF